MTAYIGKVLPRFALALRSEYFVLEIFEIANVVRIERVIRKRMISHFECGESSVYKVFRQQCSLRAGWKCVDVPNGVVKRPVEKAPLKAAIALSVFHQAFLEKADSIIEAAGGVQSA